MNENRKSLLALCAFWATIGLYCAWVLSMPVFPSQDGPLHLYYVNIFRNLLAHTPGAYSQNYYIGRYIPAYSVYYYGLILLGKVVSLEMADKLCVCLYFVTLGLGFRILLRTIGGNVLWGQFLVLPILLCWPLVMGFVNFVLGCGIACFALSLWCRNAGKPGVARRICFLLLLTVIILCHPVPWLFIIGFTGFDLGLRLILARRAHGNFSSGMEKHLPYFAHDATAVVIGMLGYFFLSSFKNLPTQLAQQPDLRGSFLHLLRVRVRDHVREYGLTLFVGHQAEIRTYRLLLTLVIFLVIALAVRAFLRCLRAEDRSYRFTWSLFAVAFLVVLPLIPSTLNGSYYFAQRLLFLLYISLAVAGSVALKDRKFGLPAALAATTFSLITLAMAIQFISPRAREIESVRNMPAQPDSRPGLLANGAATLAQLDYNPLMWAGVGYMRSHNQLLYNTSWLELAIIPVKLTPEGLRELDGDYWSLPAQYHLGLFRNPQLRAHTLSRVGYVLGMRFQGDKSRDILTEKMNLTEPGWNCTLASAWEFCAPQ